MRFYMELMVNFDENTIVFDPLSIEQIVLWGGVLATETYNITQHINECYNKIYIVFTIKYQLAI